ncbi:hypothetical protein [Comamonas terrae]|nr:hypothetical protein [Comamonas terrae]
MAASLLDWYVAVQHERIVERLDAAMQAINCCTAAKSLENCWFLIDV